MNVTNMSLGSIIKLIRCNLKITQKEFSSSLNKTDVWLSQIELDKRRLYIKDLIYLTKHYSFNIIFVSDMHGIRLNMLDFEPNDLFRFLREATGKTQSEFAKDIGYKNDWAYTIEAGVNNYYANDLFELARLNNFEIEIRKK